MLFRVTETASLSQNSLKSDRQEPTKSNRKSCRYVRRLNKVQLEISQCDIEDALKQIYGAEIIQGLVSRITDKILTEVNKWQNRPLKAIYPVVFFDGIVFNSRKDNKIVTKCVYSVLCMYIEMVTNGLVVQLSL